MKHLLHYTFEWQSLIFIAVAIGIMQLFGINKLIIDAYKQRGTAEYKAERWHLHTMITRYGMALLVICLSWFSVFQIPYLPLVAVAFGALLLGATINYLRERYVMRKTGKNKNGDYLNEVDMRDVLHGAVGGMEGAVIGFVVVLVIFFAL